jgi:hypothetical protein
MKWYFPTWNGDLRLEAHSASETLLTIIRPTAHELLILARIGEELKREDLIDVWDTRVKRFRSERRVVIRQPIAKIAAVVAKVMRPGPSVLTAIKFSDGKVATTTEISSSLIESLAAPPVLPPYRKGAIIETVTPAPASLTLKRDVEIPSPIVAVTVKRPTPSCPQCVPGSVGPASEALLSFLSPEEHETWARERYILVTGHLSGHRYALAHRHSALGIAAGRICLDVDSGAVVHFHDWTVPPEEEVLAAKLILEHREPWLRNEATMLGGRQSNVFKNPFGDITDGIADSNFTIDIGREVLRFFGRESSRRYHGDIGGGYA